MSNSSYASDLIAASQLFSVSATYTSFILGLIGNILNILVLTKTNIFHQNRCAFYLIVESIVNIGQLTQNFANEIWKRTLNGTEPSSVSLVWCKLRTILPQWHRLMLSAIICFAAIDQFLSTNPLPHLRQLSSVQIAKYQICSAACLCLLHTLPAGLFLNIHPILGCIVSSSGLTNYYSYAFYPVINGIFPIFVSSLFSLLAYRNVRRIIRRQIPLDRRRLDQQLTAMIFVRVISFVLLQLPFSVYRIYSLNLAISPANSVEYAANRWAQVISLVLVYFTHAVSFYLFVAISRAYRRQVKCFLMKKCYRRLQQCCCMHQSVIHPLNRESIQFGADLQL